MYSEMSTAWKWSIQEPTFTCTYFIAFVHRTQMKFSYILQKHSVCIHLHVFVYYHTDAWMHKYSFCKMLTIHAKHRKPYFITLYIENFLQALLSTFLYTGQYSQNIICYSDAQAMKFIIPFSTCCINLERNFLPFLTWSCRSVHTEVSVLSGLYQHKGHKFCSNPTHVEIFD
jgi:hypothetical protein